MRKLAAAGLAASLPFTASCAEFESAGQKIGLIEPDKIEIDLDDQYAHIPAAVAEQVGTALDLRAVVVVEQTDQRVRTMEALGGAVKLSDNLAITAQHVVAEDLPGGYEMPCANFVASGSRQEHDDDIVKASVISVVDSVDATNSESKDVALLETAGSSDYADLPDAELNEIESTIGERVFFVNYGITESGEDRSPTADEPELRKPSIYEGVVVESDRDDAAYVLTGYNNLGQETSGNSSTQGASGSAVYRTDGSLLGIVVAIDLVGPKSIDIHNLQFPDVDLVSSDGNQELLREKVEVITPELVEATLDDSSAGSRRECMHSPHATGTQMDLGRDTETSAPQSDQVQE